MWRKMFINLIKKFFLFLLVLVMFSNSVVFANDGMFVQAKESKENAEINSTIYKESTYKISVVDPTVLNNPSAKIYPGLRGGNQLIVYTPKFGIRTSTNEFGSEAVVVNGIVVQVNGADSVIPSNGYVISGHGKAKRWINENITVGARVEFDENKDEIRVYITPDSFIYNAKAKINEVQNILRDYNSMNIYYDDRKSLYYISKSKEYILRAQRDETNVQKFSSLAILAADKALEHSIPYSPKELKGVWVRPSETSEYQIEKILDNLKNAGITDIFLETYFHGTTIYPSNVLMKYGVHNQKQEFRGVDPLKIWIEGAHKRKMKLHVWFETFYVGNKYSEEDLLHVLNVHKNWRNTTKKRYKSENPCSSASEHNGYFLDPANPYVQDYLMKIIKEIIFVYRPDGINLDYIRYPQSLISKYPGYEDSNWGYTNFARWEFERQYNFDPLNIKYPSREWNLWALYRQEKITNFVEHVHKLTSANKIVLTTVIFPDRQRCLETKMQDWSTWSKKGIVDGLTPLVLTCDKQTAVVLLKDILGNISSKTNVYTGLFVPFMGGQPNDLLRQIHANRKLNNEGVILFDYAHLNDKYINTLTTSAFNSGKHIPKQEIIFPDYDIEKGKLDKNERRFLIFEKKPKKSSLIFLN